MVESPCQTKKNAGWLSPGVLSDDPKSRCRKRRVGSSVQIVAENQSVSDMNKLRTGFLKDINGFASSNSHLLWFHCLDQTSGQIFF